MFKAKVIYMYVNAEHFSVHIYIMYRVYKYCVLISIKVYTHTKYMFLKKYVNSTISCLCVHHSLCTATKLYNYVLSTCNM